MNSTSSSAFEIGTRPPLASLLEGHDRGLVDFDGEFALARGRIEHVRLLASANRSVQFIDESLVDQLEQNDLRSRIQHLFDGRTVRFVLLVRLSRLHFRFGIGLAIGSMERTNFSGNLTSKNKNLPVDVLASHIVCTCFLRLLFTFWLCSVVVATFLYSGERNACESFKRVPLNNFPALHFSRLK